MIIRIAYTLCLMALCAMMMHIPHSLDWAIGRLPVLHDGRIKPIDTLGREQLLTIQGRLRHPRGLSPSMWLFERFTVYESGQDDAIILVEHPRLFDEINPIYRKQKYRVSESFLTEHIHTISPFISSAQIIKKSVRTPLQSSALTLSERYHIHRSLATQFFPFHKGSQQGFWHAMIDASRTVDPNTESNLSAFVPFYTTLANAPASIRFVFSDTWLTLPEAALDTTRNHTLLLSTYLALSDAIQSNHTDSMIRQHAQTIHRAFWSFSAIDYARVQLEFIVNAINPFMVSLLLYGVIILLVFLGQLIPSHRVIPFIQRTWQLALLFHTIGIAGRVIILGRPPVINLYSSATFIAYVMAIIGYIMFKKRTMLFYAGYVGIMAVLSLIVAYHLSLSGDTMRVMEAVLNSNFWLSTHVIAMTIGYAMLFMAGFFAISYILMGTLTRRLTPSFKDQLIKIVYIFLMVSLFFNFLGTVLGGIWADQSWGRFWGWDPKENGAIMIVLWTAIILHMRWGRLITHRWFMILTVFANVVTAWSWKGTNMLGIGLHSYGFTESTFYWLILFIVSQLIVMGLGALPERYWPRHVTHDPPPSTDATHQP